MKHLLYTIHFANRTHISIRETKPKDCPRGIARDFHEALGTGMLVIGDGDDTFFLIPVANIMRIECVPVDGDDDDNGDGEYNLERLFEEDDEDDEDYDDLEEEDEDDE